MKLKKLLSLFVCLLILVSAMGVSTVSAETEPTATINLLFNSYYNLPTKVNSTSVTWTDADSKKTSVVSGTVVGEQLFTASDGTTVYKIVVGNSRTINVAKGVSYSLPTIVNSWTNYAGEALTSNSVDTSELGYQIFTGKDANGATVTYRINIGEVATDGLKDDLNKNNTEYSNDAKTIGINTVQQTVTNGSFNMDDTYDVSDTYPETSSAKAYSQHFEADGDDAYLVIGPKSTATWDTTWTPTNGGNGGFKYSMQLKVANMALGEKTVTAIGSNVPLAWRINGKDWFQLRVDNYPEGNTNHYANGRIYFAAYNCDADGAITNGSRSGTDFASLVNRKIENNILTTGWFKVDIYASATSYNVYVNDTLVLADQVLPAEARTGVDSVTIAKRSAATLYNAQSYIDDIEISRLVYYSEDLSAEKATAYITQKDYDTVCETSYDLKMNDDSVKPVTVQFTPNADATSVEGTVEGMDGKITVDYSVLPLEEPVIYSYVGDTVTLADKTTVTPDTVGCLNRTATDETSIYNYTIYTGEYYGTVTDDMQSHASTTTTVDFDVDGDKVTNDGTNADEDDVVHTIPEVTDGDMKFAAKTVTSSSAYKGTAKVITEDDGNKYVAVGPIDTDRSLVTWTPKNKIDGNFKLSFDFKVDSYTPPSGKQVASIVEVRNTSGTGLMRIQLFLAGATSNDNYVRVYANTSSTSLGYSSTFKSKIVQIGTTGTYKVNGSIHVDIYGNEYTFDAYMDGRKFLENASYKSDNSLKGGLGSVVLYKGSTKSIISAVTGVDNLSVSSYRYFNGTLPPSVNTLVAQNAQAPLTTTLSGLTLSDGSAFTPAASYTVDTEKLGTKTATATVAGFDDTVTVNAKVCNYDVTLAEALTAGSAAKLNIKNVSGNHNSAYLLAAWYESDVLKVAADPVNLSSLAKDASTISEALTIPADALTSGKLRVFIITNTGDVKPIDLDAEFSLPTA